MHRVDYEGEFCEAFAAEVHGVEVGLGGHVLSELDGGGVVYGLDGPSGHCSNGTIGRSPGSKSHADWKTGLHHSHLIGQDSSS